MKSTWFILTIVLFQIFPKVVFCQSEITITRPRLELDDNKIIIEYDILNSQQTDLFLIWIEVIDAKGRIIRAVSLSGDLGENIKGGANKKITWNLEQDDIILDEEIYIEVKAEKKKLPDVQKEVIPVETTPATDVKTVSKSNMVISSIILPGWGQSKVHQGKPYWLIGIAGYGCLAGSVYLNKQAVQTNDNYSNSFDVSERNTLYDKTVRQDNISEYLAYAAAGIWTINLIWILATPVKTNISADLIEQRKYNISPFYNPYFKSTGFTLCYRF